MKPENEEGLSFLELAQAATQLAREWEEDHPLTSSRPAPTPASPPATASSR